MVDQDGPTSPRRRGRGRWLVVALVVVAVLGTGSVVVLTRIASNTANAAPPKAEPPDTTEVRKGDLVDQQTVTGALAYGTEWSLQGRKQGTVTGLSASGAVVERGQNVYSVDAKQIPLFYGYLPLYRDLQTDMTNGPDVKIVEENLNALGFDDFGEPDEKFTFWTATAIKKWQKALGVEQTGVLGVGDVVVQAGPIRISSVSAQLGAPGAGDLMKVTGTQRVVTVDLESSKLRLAKIGEKVELTITGGGTTTGTIASVGKAVEGQDGKAKSPVTITLDDPAAAGTLDSVSVSVVFTAGRKDGVLIVPVGALLALAEGGYAVESATGGELVAVTTGLFSKGEVEVSGDGLTEGLRVVTTS
ncbi:peptidoglycan-binding domain-containing protein [Umezawaea sp. Da 62-37]|uniref:peptidoglycan-binding domain-containing protein n=1 Tax=Umezawaea sp. Da 62-37 TaxID=3075927 RepID=UPI0028F7203B|nr:peptidoglycan-binding domain-containing protein [Umezawaea sp. Da 62-37]WNV82059.1 peptidoglycan-binding domain-containing protein [Umezawaea sp. Da 62-37]